MSIITSLLVLLVISRICGRILSLFGQPEVTGEILAGLILGPAVLGLIHPSHELAGITELAVFLVILAAGLEMNLKEVAYALKSKAILIASFGFIIPFLAGLMLGLTFGLTSSQSVTLALCFSITALPVAIRILENMKILDTPLGHRTLGVAIAIDIAALLALGVVLDIPEQTSLKNILISVVQTGGKMIIFFSIILMTNWFLRKKRRNKKRARDLFDRLVERLGSEAIFGIAVLFVLVFSFLSESMGFHYIIGAFFGGLLLNKDIVGKDSYDQLQHTLLSVTNGFLTPLFFAYIGLRFTTDAFDHPFLILAIIFVAICSKTGGAWIGAKLSGAKPIEALAIGLLLNSRGLMDLVVAEIAHQRGFIDDAIFSSLVLLGILSTFSTPIMFKHFCKNLPKKLVS